MWQCQRLANINSVLEPVIKTYKSLLSAYPNNIQWSLIRRFCFFFFAMDDLNGGTVSGHTQSLSRIKVKTIVTLFAWYNSSLSLSTFYLCAAPQHCPCRFAWLPFFSLSRKGNREKKFRRRVDECNAIKNIEILWKVANMIFINNYTDLVVTITSPIHIYTHTCTRNGETPPKVWLNFLEWP